MIEQILDLEILRFEIFIEKWRDYHQRTSLRGALREQMQRHELGQPPDCMECLEGHHSTT
jgi:hypothetical protein